MLSFKKIKFKCIDSLFYSLFHLISILFKFLKAYLDLKSFFNFFDLIIYQIQKSNFF
jgi:hypothetical protein